MPQLTFHRVLADEAFSLPPFGAHELKFNATNDVVLDDDASTRPMLFFMVDPPAEAENFKLEVFIRTLSGAEEKISTWTLTGGILRTVMEPFPHKWMRKGENKVIFKGSGKGIVTVHNVVIFFQRNV